MKNIFIILGYGVPKNIFKDENYNFYLKMALNKMHDLAIAQNIQRGLIIFSGGLTDCFRPYKRYEAGEMAKLWKKINKKSFVKNYPVMLEKKSLSSLENLLFSKTIILNKKINKANIYIFGEQTRQNKLKKLAQKIFAKNYLINIVPVDFDVSANRYLDPKFIAKKEKRDFALAMWALKNKQNMAKYNYLLKERIKYLRQAGSKNHVRAVQKWWQAELDKI